MKLNHTNLCTSDVTALCTIFTRHFGFVALQTSTEFAMLSGIDGFSLVLTKIDENSSQMYPNSQMVNLQVNFHVGFVVDSQQEVYDKHKELNDAGYNLGQIKKFDAMGTTWTALLSCW
jgi:hypothetical protein